MNINTKNVLLTALMSGLILSRADAAFAKGGGHPTPAHRPPPPHQPHPQAQQRQQQRQEQRQESFRQNHPRRAEVLGRDNNMNRQINQDKGDLNGHYGQLKSEDNSIRQQEQSDAAANGGHITRQEQGQLNHEENGLNRQIHNDNSGAGNSQFQANHPRRSQVLGRDSNLNNQINQDKGDLNGHYGQLKSEDNSIRRQEQSDASANGGHITSQEQGQLNREENGLNRQIHNDNSGAGNSQFQANHPRRSQVLGRDSNLNNQINQDKGDLNGHYGQLKSEDNSIRRQEQSDASANGGHITSQEQGQLNREENGLNRQIHNDNSGAGNSQFQANHPRRSQVLGRDSNLNNQINQDKGDLNGHYGQLKSEDNSIRRQEQSDASANGGHITSQEQGQLNREENGLNRQIHNDNSGAGNAQFQANHPRRSQVLGRDSNLNNQINQDKGDLNGHYGQLKSEDNSIRRQEQSDASANGGHITSQEQGQLNREENGLNRQIHNDNSGAGNAQFQANHPRRSEVLGRDASLNNQINQDKGNLSGQYGNLKSEDNSIRHQEQRDARKNGGYITKQQQAQLNNEESNLQSQVNMDK